MTAVHIPRPKILVPIPKWQWREPSRAIPRDDCGNPIVQVRFRARAKTHDGVILWAGWFDDRDDFDEFVLAVVTGTIQDQPPLWRLPTPMWPELDPSLLYDFDSVSFWTSTSTASWSTPVDWRDDANKLEAIGGAGSQTSSTNCSGGAGCYAAVTNQSLSGSYNYRAGIADGTSGAGTSYTYNTWFGSILLAVGGPDPAGAYSGGISDPSDCVGSIIYKGGDSGNYYGTNAPNGGAGGAAGPHGAGVNGQHNNAGGWRVAGGAGDAGYGGAGGQSSTNTGSGFPGSNGTEWDATHGAGGGSGGGSPGYSQSAGGSYGAAGHPAKQGLLVITYTPRWLGLFGNPTIGG